MWMHPGIFWGVIVKFPLNVGSRLPLTALCKPTKEALEIFSCQEIVFSKFLKYLMNGRFHQDVSFSHLYDFLPSPQEHDWSNSLVFWSVKLWSQLGMPNKVECPLACERHQGVVGIHKIHQQSSWRRKILIKFTNSMFGY